LNAEYQYLLEGFQDDWVDGVQRLLWVSKNLPSGQYVFKVRTKFANFTGSYRRLFFHGPQALV
jgi:hypothetical protein